MPRISVLMYPEPGHILPTLRIAQRLVRLGHVVTYVTAQKLEPLLSGIGCGLEPVFDDATGADTMEHEGTSDALVPDVPGVELWRRVAQRYGGQDANVRAAVRAASRSILAPAVAATRPDLLLCDSKMLAACGDIIRGVCDVPTIGLRTELPIGDPIDVEELVLCPETLELPAFRQRVAGRHYCEPSVFVDRATVDAREVTAHPDGERLVYCSLGTQAASYPQAPQVLASVVDAFAERPGWRLVIAAGALAGHSLLRREASNVTIARSVDQLALLRRASFAILHGGLGGIKESILAGVPMLLVPFVFDQRPNAERVTFHGLGRYCLPDDITTDGVFGMAEAICLDEGLHRAVRAMQGVFRDAESAEPSQRHIEPVLARIAAGAES
jgi:UDP:flavonoid glycosyltransferase YjiC (YdhE family)